MGSKLNRRLAFTLGHKSENRIVLFKDELRGIAFKRHPALVYIHMGRVDSQDRVLDDQLLAEGVVGRRIHVQRAAAREDKVAFRIVVVVYAKSEVERAPLRHDTRGRMVDARHAADDCTTRIGDKRPGLAGGVGREDESHGEHICSRNVVGDRRSVRKRREVEDARSRPTAECRRRYLDSGAIHSPPVGVVGPLEVVAGSRPDVRAPQRRGRKQIRQSDKRRSTKKLGRDIVFHKPSFQLFII